MLWQFVVGARGKKLAWLSNDSRLSMLSCKLKFNEIKNARDRREGVILPFKGYFHRKTTCLKTRAFFNFLRHCFAIGSCQISRFFFSKQNNYLNIATENFFHRTSNSSVITKAREPLCLAKSKSSISLRNGDYKKSGIIALLNAFVVEIAIR